MSKKLERKNANFEFAIHQNLDKGPNRICFEPEKALSFFRRIKAKEKYAGIKVKHLYTGLVWETDDAEDLKNFIDTVVETVGASVYG
jgi:hypothetical protein